MIARVPCRSCHHLCHTGPTNPIGQRMTPVPPRQTHARMWSLILISSISCLFPLPLNSHRGHVPSGSFTRAWTPLSVSWADLRKSLPSPHSEQRSRPFPGFAPWFCRTRRPPHQLEMASHLRSVLSTFGLGFQTTNPNQSRSRC